jgi:hypothetical protein
MSPPLDIRPDTRIGALLEAYPQLEDVLIEQAAVFKKLRNPVLRKTVARVATVEKAAQIAGLSPRDLLRTLRAAVGQDVTDWEAPGHEAAEIGAGVAGIQPEPPWVETNPVSETIDADAILAAGEAPLPGVLRHANALEPGRSIRLVSSFRPAPLIDALHAKGFHTWTHETPENRFETFIARV